MVVRQVALMNATLVQVLLRGILHPRPRYEMNSRKKLVLQDPTALRQLAVSTLSIVKAALVVVPHAEEHQQQDYVVGKAM